MTKSYSITEWGLINQGVHTRLGKYPTKSGYTLNDVLDVLKESTKPVTASVIAKELNDSPKDTKRMLQSLVKMHYAKDH